MQNPKTSCPPFSHDQVDHPQRTQKTRIPTKIKVNINFQHRTLAYIGNP